jgi:hypothetical protein
MPDQGKGVEAFVSRVIEYLPATLGDDGGVIARDCWFAGNSFSAGMQITQPGGTYECTGDKDGSWKKVAP